MTIRLYGRNAGISTAGRSRCPSYDVVDADNESHSTAVHTQPTAVD